eukprot:3455851-Amphidinium_carterae.1
MSCVRVPVVKRVPPSLGHQQHLSNITPPSTTPFSHRQSLCKGQPLVRRPPPSTWVYQDKVRDGVPARLDLHAMSGPTPAAAKHRERLDAQEERLTCTCTNLPFQGQGDYVAQAMRETTESLVESSWSSASTH